MKKLISIILTVVLSLSVFSCVSCSANFKQASIYPDKELLNYLTGSAFILDILCATQGNGETDQEYAQRMASSPEVGKCILSILNEDENVIDLYNKIEVRYFLSEKLKNRHPNNTIFENFVNRFIKVFNEKYNLKK